MTESNEPAREERSAIRHLEAALEISESEEVNYHVRQALQLLDLE